MKSLQKSLVIIFLTIFGVLFSISNSWGLKDIGMKIQCNNVSIYDHQLGEIIFNKNADEIIKPGSLAKIMTAYIVFDKLKNKEINYSDKFFVSSKAWKMGGSRTFLNLNSEVSIHDLLLGLIVQKGNDSAVVLAEGISGNENDFAIEMNKYAKKIGMKKTFFTNSTGWPGPDLRTTSRDLLVLAKNLIENFPEYYQIYENNSFTYNGIKQTNNIFRHIKGIDGLVSGNSNESGRGFVISAKKNNKRITLSAMRCYGGFKSSSQNINLALNSFFQNEEIFIASNQSKKINDELKKLRKNNLPMCSTLPENIKHNCYGVDVNIYGTIKYEGEYQNNKRHGYGIVTLKNGEKYSGEWKNGKKHGRGEEIWANGEKFIGIFENGNLVSDKIIVNSESSISSAELEEERQKRLELEQELAELKNKQKKEKQKINSDNQEPIINVFSKLDGSNAVISGRVTDNTEIAEVLVDGEAIILKNNGTFETELYVPRSGLNVEIVAYDKKGNKASKLLKLERGNIQQASGPTFDRLNPSGKRVKSNPNALALIIGVADYEKTSAQAIYADSDAKMFYDYAMMKLGIPSSNIKELINDKADESEILLSVKEWLRRSAKPNKSDIYVFFAGHGLASQDGKNMYLLPHDGSPRLLDDTAILRDRLFADLKATNPKSVTVFLDTCYSGVTRNEEMLIAGRPIVIKAKEQAIPDGFTLFSAASNEQISRPLEEAKHGMFSYFLMKGMEGDADINSDNKITAQELHNYVKENVTQQSSGSQTPELQGDKDRVLVQFN